jgi:hypothetical protein
MTVVVDLNADVAAMLRLRAAAALPQFIALCGVVFALLFFAIGLTGWTATLVLLAAAAAFLFVAREIERGASWPLWPLTAATVTMTVLAVRRSLLAAATLRSWRRAGRRRRILMLAPCWTSSCSGEAVPQRDAVSATYAVSSGHGSRRRAHGARRRPCSRSRRRSGVPRRRRAGGTRGNRGRRPPLDIRDRLRADRRGRRTTVEPGTSRSALGCGRFGGSTADHR